MRCPSCGVECPPGKRFCEDCGTAPDAKRFDVLAPSYDQVVPFFGLLGERLVQWTGPTPGQRVLDLGAGRGAVTSPGLVRSAADTGYVGAAVHLGALVA